MNWILDKRSATAAWIGWVVLFLIAATIVASGGSRTVVPAYRGGAEHWIAGENLYEQGAVGGFTYLPQAAILFVPFAMIPVIASEVLWRLVNIGVFAFGVRRFAWLGGQGSVTELFPLMTLVTLPLAWDCARNGQATLIMTGLMLLAVVDVARSHWWRATLWLVLGVSFKPLAIVLALLLAAVYRPMVWRVLVGAAIIAFMPFMTQHPTYVMQQYAAFWSTFTNAAHVGTITQDWTSPFHALRLAGVNIQEHVQTGIRIAAAFATLALCIVAREKHDSARTAVLVFSLAVLYVILFSPRTENNTYAMLGPAIAFFLSQSFLALKRYASALLLTAIVFLLMGSRQIERMLTPHAGTSWLSPLMAVLFSGYVVLQVFDGGVERDDRRR